MNIDRELMSLLEDCIYQEGLLQKFKDKKANKQREKVLRDRRELREEIKKLPVQLEVAIEEARVVLIEDYSFEGVYEILADGLILAQSVVKCANILENEEVLAAKKFIAGFERTRNTIMKMIIVNGKKQEDKWRTNESINTMQNATIKTINTDCRLEFPSMVYKIENIIKAYNQLMAERQHPTDN